MKILLADLKKRPEWHTLMLQGKVSACNRYLILPDDPAIEVPRAVPGSIPPILPIPKASWPGWANTISLSRKPGDIGVGDTAERLLGIFGGALFKKGFKTLTGGDCGCSARKESWNQLYRY
jgi:hypothetical protein